MRRPLALGTVLVALTVLTTSAPAGAATLTNANGTLTYTGAGAAASDITISGSTTVTLVREAGDNDPISTSGCTANPAETQFTCNGMSLVVIHAGAGDDFVDAAALGVTTAAYGEDGDDDISTGVSADLLQGGAGDDILDGGGNADTLDGGAGNDDLDGGTGADSLTGGDGNDTLFGEAGEDSITGGAGQDSLDGGADSDTLSGEDGDDVLSDGGGSSDVLSGGAGLDRAELDSRPTVSVTLDGAPNDGGPGESLNVLADIEDVTVVTPSNGSATIVGNAQPNVLNADGGRATITGGAGADSLYGSAFDDTIDARDGYPDRVVCGGGNDTALVDTLDQVSPTCENAPVAAVPGGADDRPPTIAWTGPAAGATLRGNTPTTLSVDAADDRGVAKVQFYDDDRLLCEDTTPPYTCAYQARGADVGRDTLIATAVDGAAQTVSAIRLIEVTRFQPALALKLSPTRDRRPSYVFRARGTLTNAGECSGTVTITAKAGKRTVSSRRAKVTSRCTYAVTVRFKKRPAARLKFTARYGGNSATLAASAKSRTARLG